MPEWLTTLNLNGWSIAGIVITIVTTWLLAWLARTGVSRVVERVPNLGDGVKVLAVRLTGYAIWLIGIGVALSFIGASIQPVLAVAIIIGVVLVLVLRGVADNFASGVVLQTRHPFGVGDLIESGEFSGQVLELNGRSVVIRTGDGRTVHIPNSSILSEPLVNHSEHAAKRSEVEVRTNGGDPIQDLRETLERTANSVNGVHQRESVDVFATERGGQLETFHVRFWHHPAHGEKVTAAVVDALADVLASRGVAARVTSVLSPHLRLETRGEL